MTGVQTCALPIYLSGGMPLGKSIGMVAGIGFAMVVLVVFFLPETRGKQLAVYD